MAKAARQCGSGRASRVRAALQALLKDYEQFGSAFEVDLPSAFANSGKYLAAAIEAANDKKLRPDDLAKKHGLDAAFLKKWIGVLAVEPFTRNADPETVGRVVSVIAAGVAR
ncbi:MAG: hypothetical protein U0792_04695 [Gemmataceae bacterium]